MKDRFKRIIKLNLFPLFFITVSFISITLAWFAYSGLASVNTTIGVQAWYIEFKDENDVSTNNIVISADDIYPGMDTITETVSVSNLGDSDAQLSYDITSARILDSEYSNIAYTDEELTDMLSHNYPFHVNISFDKRYVEAEDGTAQFKVSISWPLDSDTDELDSKWGSDSYAFEQSEKAKSEADSTYNTRPSIKIIIDLKAEQFVDSNLTIDKDFNLGDSILYDVYLNHSCTEASDTCIRTYVIDTNSTLNDSTVTLLPTVLGNYGSSSYNEYSTAFGTITSSWNVTTRSLTIDDLMKVISTDIIDSKLVRNDLSDSVVGYLNSESRVTNELLNATNYNGYYKFSYDQFSYLSSNKCYWTSSSYDDTKSWALSKDDLNGKLYGETKDTLCNIVPVIIASKSNIDLENE